MTSTAIFRLTIAANGKVSGKIFESGKTWALTAASFSRVEVLDAPEQLESLDERLVFRATVIGTAGKEALTNEVTVTAGTRDACPYRCGVVSGWLTSASAGEPAWTAYQNLWKRADTKADMPVIKKDIKIDHWLGEPGDANNKLTITFKKDGAVAFAGKVGGASVSGSSQLVWGGGRGATALPDGWYVTIYAPPKGAFAGWCATFPVKLTLDEQKGVLNLTFAAED